MQSHVCGCDRGKNGPRACTSHTCFRGHFARTRTCATARVRVRTHLRNSSLGYSTGNGRWLLTWFSLFIIKFLFASQKTSGSYCCIATNYCQSPFFLEFTSELKFQMLFTTIRETSWLRSHTISCAYRLHVYFSLFLLILSNMKAQTLFLETV